ncbi:MAG TPA: hypothetical protein VL122_09105 [Nitrospirota bacterium]|nr:hypothetical protein [Nitrospirota bacterium]
MRILTLSWFLMLSLAFRSATAGELKELDLSDGSTITGEVQSLSNGIYTVKSESLGIIKIEASKIQSIHAISSSVGARTGNGISGGEIKSLQEKMLNDTEIMSLILTLQNDPEFKKILEDPEIMKAVNAGDVAALQANPRFMKLLNNTTIKEIGGKVK